MVETTLMSLRWQFIKRQAIVKGINFNNVYRNLIGQCFCPIVGGH